jgi:tetratricopeptide (TPR) repeat protein
LAIFDVATAKLKNRVNARGLTVLTHSTDGKLLITGNGDGRIGLRDSTTGAERLSFAPKETAGIAWSLCCSRDGSLLASGHQGGAIYLWQLPSGRLHAALRGNTSAVGSLAFFPDGKTLASSNDNGEVKLWDVATGQERVTFRLGHRLALSRDGQTLVAGTKSKAWVIRASTAAEALDRKSELNTDDPESPLADLDGGDRHWVAGEKHEAEEAYRRGHDRLQALVDHFPEDTHCRRELVRSALSMRLLLLDPAAAGAGEELWRQAQAHYQKLPPEEQLALARSYSTMAERLRKAGSKEAALRTHTLATELKADDPSVWFSRAYFFGANGESAQAIAAYRRAVELSPNSAEHHNNLARMLATTPEAKLRDFAQAVTLAKKAVEIAPKKGAYHNTLGVAHYGAGDWKAALGSLEKSMELRKGGDSHDWFFLAMTHWQLGAKDKARAWYDRAVQWMDKNQPDNEELRRFRAEAAELLGLNEKK